MGGEWGDYDSYLSFFVIVPSTVSASTVDGLSSVFIAHIVFSTNNTPSSTHFQPILSHTTFLFFFILYLSSFSPRQHQKTHTKLPTHPK
jgi:hypothetical protein